MTLRDNFAAKTIRTLASRVGHICSNPACRRATSGPAADEDRAINLGVAAHITAAAPGGPRYDSTLSNEARRAAENGIWLCQNCAKLVDSDVAGHSADLLRQWKVGATNSAFLALASAPLSQTVSKRVTIELDDADREFLRQLALPAEESLEALTTRMREAAASDLASFRNARNWPAYTIGLSLQTQIDDVDHDLSVEGFARAISVAQRVVLAAPPGTGKTTTLVQLAEAMIGSGEVVPLFLPLGEWSGRLDDFFESCLRRNAFRSSRREHFMRLAYDGRLALILDGWNELDPESRLRAIRDLAALERDFPLLHVVIGGRPHAASAAVQTVAVQPLNEEQQLELARAVRGEEGAKIIDQAWRVAGLRELISTPLYLNALVLGSTGSSLPQTKEAVLRLFVKRHEEAPDKAEILRKELLGFHAELLTALAVAATLAKKTSLSDQEARLAISGASAKLVAAGQLSHAPQPSHVLETLVDCHLLVRATATPSGVSFQHQQFQEWYAASHAERLMQGAAAGNIAEREQLRGEVLNWPAWEEAVLFACERVSRGTGDGARVVAQAIREALGIDPMLAAEMIYRSTAGVWDIISLEVCCFVARWHKPGKVDRAVRFMIMSGRPEFASYIWPLISSPDDQIALRALREGRRFHPTVLGPDAAAHLAALPDKIRERVLSEIAHNSGFDGMELAAGLAKADPNAEVVAHVVSSLEFRRADRHVVDILRSSPDAVWNLIAKKGFPDAVADDQLNEKLQALRASVQEHGTDPVSRINFWLEGQQSPDTARKIEALIASPDVSAGDQHVEHAIRRAAKGYPGAVAEALVARIAAGLDMPFRSYELLGPARVHDEGPIRDAALNPKTPKEIAQGAFAVVGPQTVGVLMDQLLALSEAFAAPNTQPTQEERDEYWRITGAISTTRQSTFFTALAERAGSDSPRHIRELAELVVRHGDTDHNTAFVLSRDERNMLLPILLRWIDVMLTAPEATRHHAGHVAWAIVRLPFVEVVPGVAQMLERDLAVRARARAAFLSSPRRGPTPADVTHSYTLQYRSTFAAIGGIDVINRMKGYLRNLEFGHDAACVLLALWQREHPPEGERGFGWDNFSQVRTQRRLCQQAAGAPPTCDFAESIFDIVRELSTPDRSDEEISHAIKLAMVGLAMPHGMKSTEVNGLLGSRIPYVQKQGLFTSAARAGEILSADLVLAGTRQLLDEAKAQTWRLDDNRGELMGWLVLFAFTDRPIAVLDVIDELPPRHREPWQLRRLYSALRESPHPDALGALEALAQRDPRVLGVYEWVDALANLDTEEAARALLRTICDGRLSKGQSGIDAWRLADILAARVRTFPALNDELKRRYREMSAGEPRAIIERALLDGATPENVLLVIEHYGAVGRSYDGNLAKAIRELAVGQRPADDWPGAYNLFSVPLVALRKQLFAMAGANGHLPVLAERCLVAIERLRDEYDRIEDEPRHPDIESGKPWPKEVSDSQPGASERPAKNRSAGEPGGENSRFAPGVG